MCFIFIWDEIVGNRLNSVKQKVLDCKGGNLNSPNKIILFFFPLRLVPEISLCVFDKRYNLVVDPVTRLSICVRQVDLTVHIVFVDRVTVVSLA